MSKPKMTKNGLRSEEILLKQLNMYLPTLRQKKNLLQAQVNIVKNKIAKLFLDLENIKRSVLDFCFLLSSKNEIDLIKFVNVNSVQKSYENIAGVEIPQFERVIFSDQTYDLFNTPIWFDSAIEKIKYMTIESEKIKVEEEKKRAIEKELKDVSIRVNLFEKILIPKTLNHIKKIKIFLQDQELASISRAKIAKMKKERI